METRTAPQLTILNTHGYIHAHIHKSSKQNQTKQKVLSSYFYVYVCVVCACMCVLCVRDMYIQRCRRAPEHTRIHILMQTLTYVEVWNIMVRNPNVSDPNKHEQTPDVVIHLNLDHSHPYSNKARTAKVMLARASTTSLTCA